LFLIIKFLVDVLPTIISPKLSSFSSDVINAYFPTALNLINFGFSSFIWIIVVASNSFASFAVILILIDILLLGFIMPDRGYISNIVWAILKLTDSFLE